MGGPGHEPSKHELAARDPEATFYDDEIRSPVQVCDLAAALLELAALDVSGRSTSPAQTTSHVPSSPSSRPGGPCDACRAPPGRPLDCSLDSSRAADLLRTELRGVRTVFA